MVIIMHGLVPSRSSSYDIQLNPRRMALAPREREGNPVQRPMSGAALPRAGLRRWSVGMQAVSLQTPVQILSPRGQ